MQLLSCRTGVYYIHNHVHIQDAVVGDQEIHVVLCVIHITQPLESEPVAPAPDYVHVHHTIRPRSSVGEVISYGLLPLAHPAGFMDHASGRTRKSRSMHIIQPCVGRKVL